MRTSWSILLFFFLLFLSPLNAKTYRYRVYLKDKGEATSSLSSPERFLSVAALERRARQHIAIDKSDLPISRNYLDSLEAQGAHIVTQSKWMQTVVVDVPDTTFVRRLSRLSMVDSVRFVWQGDADAFSSEQTDNAGRYEVDAERKADFYGYGEKQIELLQGHRLHKRGFQGEGMRIAVIDAGFRHVDCLNAFDSIRLGGTYNALAPGQTVFGYDNHGTKVLSCLAAYLPGILVGTAPKATYWLIKSEDSRAEYPIEEDYWLAAAEYADSVGVDVITSSLGYFSFDEERLSYKPSQLDGRTSLISRGASMAARKGILVFSSAGNEGNSSWGTITVPADADGILTVGAIDEKKKRSLFSSIGYSADGRVKPDVVALGTDCAVIEPDGALRFSSGTSFATPILAGACACVWQALPWLSSRDLVRLVRKYASLSKQPNPELGYGLPNLYKLYKKEKRYAPKD